MRAAFLDGGAWSSRGTASLNVDSRRTAYAPSVGRDGQGRPAVAFAEEGSVFLKRWDGSAWTVVGPGPVATGYATDPAVGFDGDQPYVAVAHLSTGAVRVYTLAQGAWTAIPGDPRRSTTQPARRPAIAVSGPGHFVLAWTEGRISEYPIDAGALYASRWNGTEWVELGGALNRGTDHPAYAPAIAVDGPVGAEGDAFPIVLWTERESPAGTNEDWNLRLARANR